MSDPVPGRVFISYRRQDARGSAGRIYDRCADRFGSDQVFMDVDNLPPGADFNKVITQAVSQCRVLLAIIGPGWLDAKEKRRRRLDDPGDLVRLEIAAALKRDILVIPILVEDAMMPRGHELPRNLVGLAGRNAHRVRHESFRSDVDRLLAAIEPILRAATDLPPSEPAQATPNVLASPSPSGSGQAAAKIVDSAEVVSKPSPPAATLVEMSKTRRKFNIRLGGTEYLVEVRADPFKVLVDGAPVRASVDIGSTRGAGLVHALLDFNLGQGSQGSPNARVSTLQPATRENMVLEGKGEMIGFTLTIDGHKVYSDHSD